MKIALITMESIQGILTNNYSMIETCNYFVDKGIETFLLISRTSSKIPRSKIRIIEIGKKESSIKQKGFFRQLLFNLTYILKALNYIYKISPEIIMCNSTGYVLYINSLISIFLSKILRINHIQVWIGSDLLTNNTRLSRCLKKSILIMTDINMVQSNHMVDIAKRLGAKSNIIKIPNKGVDIEKFQNLNIKSKEINKDDNNIILLYVGRYHPIKGVDYLIEAFINIVHKVPNISLHLVGISNEIMKEFPNLNSNKISNKIKFFGNIPHRKIINFYDSADLLLLPSIMEGLSNVIMEGMAAGLPMVVTNVGGNKELIIEGKGGFLVPPRDTQSLANAIMKLVENPKLRKKMSEFNKKRIKEYDTKKIMDMKLKVLKFLTRKI